MVVRSDWSGGKTSGAGTGITADPNAQLSFAQPMVQTYAPDTGWSQPAGNTAAPYANPAPVGSQSAYQNNAWSPPAAGPADPAPSPGPAAPAAPVNNPHGAKAYSQMDAAGQQGAQTNWLGGDSDYAAQIGEYNKALQDFTDRIANQKTGFKTDTDNAIAANDKNLNLSSNQLGEDFGARGMAYSGLWDKSLHLMQDRYKEQGTNIGTVGAKNQTDADNRLADFSNQNGVDQANAKRAALGRMFQNQQLADSQQTF